MEQQNAAQPQPNPAITSRSQVQPALDALGEQNASNVFDVVMGAALALGASDVHIDATDQGAAVRMRIDGILYDVASLNEHLERLILSRAKLVSGLTINVQNIPQEGRFTLQQPDRNVEVRVSTLPSQFGEDIALRLLDPRSLLSLEQLGMRSDLQQLLQKQLAKPLGLILVTGPTGSGKTTTLYACLRYLHDTSVKVVTIEDPIEYHLEGISQSQIDEEAGYNFAEGLKAILRQDPDIVMLSELRERESADAALQASLAGRRVLSTLHTNDAAGAVPRLMDMGADAEVIASGLSAALAQRLLRRLCEKCRVSVQLAPEQHALFSSLTASVSQEARSFAEYPATVWTASENGCEACSETGYKGRIGVFEIFVNDDSLQELIMSRPAEEELRDKLIERGMSTMVQDALIRVAQGVTSLSEINRVLGVIEASSPTPSTPTEGRADSGTEQTQGQAPQG